MKGEMRRGLPSPKIMVVDGCLSHEKGRGMSSRCYYFLGEGLLVGTTRLTVLCGYCRMSRRAVRVTSGSAVDEIFLFDPKLGCLVTTNTSWLIFRFFALSNCTSTFGSTS